MSSRKGNVISTDKFIDEMKTKALEVMQASKMQVDKDDENEVAEQIALGAMKYGMLSYELRRDIRFDKDKTIQLSGKTGPYLQYTHARIQGIKRKVDMSDLPKVDDLEGVLASAKKEEIDLLRFLYQFPETVEASAANYEPLYITEYLYDLAQLFNSFYHASPILPEKDKHKKAFRMYLALSVAQVLENGLKLLGITAPERM